MDRSYGILIPSTDGQSTDEKRDDKDLIRQEVEKNLRAGTQGNAVGASSTPPARKPIQLELFPGRAGPPKAKPATKRKRAIQRPFRRDGVQGEH
ncbi:MAG TPA: hypothetical protein ENI27_01050 [bacterium]|nr:hypothetical protein [bacterium]